MGYNGIKLGSRIYSARIRKGFTQTEVGSLLKLTQPAYSRYESGERDVTLKMLYELSEIFDVSVNYFIVDGEDLTDLELIDLTKYKDFLLHSRK